MRRSDREIKSRDEIENIINSSNVLRMAMSKNNIPYILPFNYGYDGEKIYIHSAKEGKKIDYIKSNPNVAFEISKDIEIIKDKLTTYYKSIVGFGKAYIVENSEEKKYALDIIMKQHGIEPFDYKKCFENTKIIKIEIENITGKKNSSNNNSKFSQ